MQYLLNVADDAGHGTDAVDPAKPSKQNNGTADATDGKGDLISTTFVCMLASASKCSNCVN